MNPTLRYLVQKAHWFVVLVWLLTNMAIAMAAESDGDPSSASSKVTLSEKIDFFENRIRPILVEHCYECHTAENAASNGELRLDIASGLAKGGTRGPALATNHPADSLLLKAIRYEINDLQMPPAGKLPQQAIDDIRVWIENGAVDPRNDSATATPMQTREQAAGLHWSFLPLSSLDSAKDQITEPEATNRQVDKPSSIDRLLAIGLKSKELTPNPSATKRELIRRLYCDLLGMQPTWEQYQAWEQEPLENYASWVDQLLASPHFGERMARHWMDVSRYADTKGYVFQEDREYANAWRFRDWLIQSFNDDMPFDRFASLQIAADRMDPGPENKNLDAMGFLTLGRRFLNNENDIADDRIDVITRGFMGLSVACARCHDHKFDAIGMADYYSMHAALVSSKEPKDEPGPLRLVDSDKIRAAVIFKRGQPGQRGPEVPKRFVSFLTTVARPMTTGSGRLELAQAIVDPKNPLTPRVFVNRVWGWLNGVPLVDTPSDFGMRCPPPPQQALLDHLAAEFVAEGYGVKHLIKRIVLSDVYRRASHNQPEAFAADPENFLWWRGNRRRLDFESLRDSILVACQLLDPAIGGASIKLIDPPFSNRRTVYAYIDRQNLPGVFRSFDFASPDAHVANRLSTTVPQQGLFMMNSQMVEHYSTESTKRWLTKAESNSLGTEVTATSKIEPIVESMFHSILLRSPTAVELERSRNYLRSTSVDSNDIAKFAWSDFVQALLSTNEFCFID